jgi:two-component system, sensor histidine kinase and response regulator
MIEIGLRKNKKEAILVIRDEGAGMTELELKNLLNFETTFSKTGTYGEKGSGIGFTFAREFIERNGGWIKVKSQPGSGTQIFIGLKTK